MVAVQGGPPKTAVVPTSLIVVPETAAWEISRWCEVCQLDANLQGESSRPDDH